MSGRGVVPKVQAGPERRDPADAASPWADVWVERSRLLERLLLDDVTPVVMVSGPAGAGKSTLVRQYLERASRPAAEVRLRGDLDDPGALTLALLAALDTLGPPTDRARAVVAGTEPDLSGVALPALAAVVAGRPGPFVLVVDDIHLLARPDTHAVLLAVVDAVPPGSRLVLLGRGATPDWLARARAERRLLEIGPDDLALDAAEARVLLRGQGVAGTDDDLDLIAHRTEGWAAGLYLTALAIRNGGRGADTGPPQPAAGTDRFIADYLRTQVLDPLDATERDFLVDTSVLDELTGPACDALLERTGSSGVLTTLSDRLQLVIPLDRDGRSYRYHHLLSDALHAELRSAAVDRETVLQARAADWLASTGDLDAAIRHAVASGDLARAGRLVWSGVLPSITAGEPDRLRQWLAALTDAQRESDPWLSLASALDALQGGRGEEMDRWLLRCAVHAGPGWQARARAEEYCALLAATHSVVGAEGLPGLLTMTSAALAGLPADSGFRPIAAFIRGVALTLLREATEGERMLHEAARLAAATGTPLLRADALSWLGLLAVDHGDWDGGSTLIAEAADLIDDHNLDRLASSAHCLTARALLEAARGHAEEAAVLLGTVRRMLVITEHIAPWFGVVGRAVQARIAVLLGDAATARQLVVEAADHMTPDLRGTLAEDLLAGAEEALSAMVVEGVRADALTDAELRVLQYLPTHLTLPQIGEHLFLSTNTVKSHVLATYRKLQVSSRSDAVSRARALGLLAAPPR